MPSIRRNGRSPKSYSGKQSAFSNDVYLVGAESDRERDRDQRGVSGSPRKFGGKRILSDIDRTTTFHDFAGDEDDNGDTDHSQGPIAFDNTKDRSDSDGRRRDDGDARSDRYLGDRQGFPGWVTMVDSDAFRGEYDRNRRLRLGICSNSRDYQERFIIPGEGRSNMVTLVRYKPKRCRRLRARTVMFIVLGVLLISVCMASVVLTSLRPGTDTPATTPPVFRYYEADGTITVDGEMTSGLANKSSDEYKTFSRDFCVALQETQTSADSAYRETYQGCLVYDIINGSIVVKFRLFYSPIREVVTVEILGDIQRTSGNLGRFTVDLLSLTLEVSVQETSGDPTTASDIVLAPNITSSFSKEIIVTITALETTAATTTALATLTTAAAAETTTIAPATTSAIIATAQTIKTEAATVPTTSKAPPTTPTSIAAAITTSTLEKTEVATTAVKPTAAASITLAVATSATVPTAAATSSKPIIDTAITTTKPTTAANTTQEQVLNSTFYSMVMSNVSLPSQIFIDDTPTETISNLSISPTVVQQVSPSILNIETKENMTNNITISSCPQTNISLTNEITTNSLVFLSNSISSLDLIVPSMSSGDELQSLSTISDAGNLNEAATASIISMSSYILPSSDASLILQSIKTDIDSHQSDIAGTINHHISTSSMVGSGDAQTPVSNGTNSAPMLSTVSVIITLPLDSQVTATSPSLLKSAGSTMDLKDILSITVTSHYSSLDSAMDKNMLTATSLHSSQTSLCSPQISNASDDTAIFPTVTSLYSLQSRIHSPQISSASDDTVIFPTVTSLYPTQSRIHSSQISNASDDTVIFPTLTSLYPTQSSIHSPQISSASDDTVIFPTVTSLYPTQSSIHSPQISSASDDIVIFPTVTSLYPTQSSIHSPQISSASDDTVIFPTVTSLYPTQSSIHSPQISSASDDTVIFPTLTSLYSSQSSIHSPQISNASDDMLQSITPDMLFTTITSVISQQTNLYSVDILNSITTNILSPTVTSVYSPQTGHVSVDTLYSVTTNMLSLTFSSIYSPRTRYITEDTQQPLTTNTLHVTVTNIYSPQTSHVSVGSLYSITTNTLHVTETSIHSPQFSIYSPQTSHVSVDSLYSITTNTLSLRPSDIHSSLSSHDSGDTVQSVTAALSTNYEGNADDVLLTAAMDSGSDNATVMNMSTPMYSLTSPTSTEEYTVLSTISSQQSEVIGQSYFISEKSEVIAQAFSSPSTLSIETVLHSSQFESSTVGLSEDRYGMSGTDLLTTTDRISLSSEPGLVSSPIISYIESSGNMKTVSTAFLVQPSRNEANYTSVTDHLTPSNKLLSIGSNLLSHINSVSSTDDTTTALGFPSTIESSVQVSIFSDAEDISRVTLSGTNTETIATHGHVSGTAGTIALNTSSIEPFFDQVLETSFTSNIDTNYEFPSTVNPGLSSPIQKFANSIVINLTTFSSVVNSVEYQTFNPVNSSFSINIVENPVNNTESGFPPLASTITSTNSQIHILLASASASVIVTAATTTGSSNSIHGSENTVIMSNDVSTYNVMSQKEINEFTSPIIDPLSTNNHVSTVTRTNSLFVSGSENINTGYFTSSSVYMDSSSKYDSSEDNSNIDAIDIARSPETTVTYNYDSSQQTLHISVLSITPSSSSYVVGQSENV